MRVFHQKNVSAAARYYTEAKEYYGPGADRTHSPGRYFGRGAAALGLTPSIEVSDDVFRKLCRNINPRSGERLTERNRGDRRVLTDVTLSVPKSVSIVWGLAQDERIAGVVLEAALDTFAEIEQDAATRVNLARGHMTLAKTRNVVGVAWLHRCARPVDGWPDPQLHVHGTFLNVTHTGGDRWTALDLSSVVRDSAYFEAQFQSRLASKLVKLGYPVVRNARDFEIAGTSRPMINKFSRRTQLIDAEAKQRGIRTKALKDAIGARTRGRKQTDSGAPRLLPQTWRDRLSDAEMRQLHRVASCQVDASGPHISAADAVIYAAEHLLERDSVVRKRQLIRTALVHSMGTATVEQVSAEVAARPWISQGHDEDELVTTAEVLAEERRIVAFARAGRGQVDPLVARPRLQRNWLSDEQQAAIRSLLESTDRLQIVAGVAGSGKTSLMNEAIERMEQAGWRVTVLAPTAEAAHGVLRDREGFDAQTVEYFLKSSRAQSSARGGVLWIDEAGLLGTRAMARLIDVTARIDARVILSGDVLQHQPVERGAALRLIEQEAGVTPHVVRTLRRQASDDYRDAVRDFSRRDPVQGFDKLVRMGRVHEIADESDRARRIARDYADALAGGHSTLVVSPSHAERAKIIDAIRTELKSRGVVDAAQERLLPVLQSRRSTVAQRSDAVQYTPGQDIVEFHRNAPGGWKSGRRATVEKVSEGRVYAAAPQGLVEVPLAAAESFDVYRMTTLATAPGDSLRITKNRQPVRGENTRRLNNGALVTVAGFTSKGRLKLADGQVIDPSWGHFDYGATVTSYAAQGKTYDRVLIAQSALSHGASSPEQAYVSVSRGRRQVDWYTDNVAELRRAIGRDRPNLLASELAPRETQHTVERRRHDLWERSRRFAEQQLERFRRWASAQRLELGRTAS